MTLRLAKCSSRLDSLESLQSLGFGSIDSATRAEVVSSRSGPLRRLAGHSSRQSEANCYSFDIELHWVVAG